MANLYGVANAPLLPLILNTIGNVDIACPANTETNFIQTPALIAPSQGFFYPMAWCGVHILTGATPPTSVVIALRINNGADLGSAGIDASMLLANANSMIYYTLIGPASQTAWQGTGSQIQLSANFATQAGTVKFPSTTCTITLFRAPDQ